MTNIELNDIVEEVILENLDVQIEDIIGLEQQNLLTKEEFQIIESMD